MTVVGPDKATDWELSTLERVAEDIRTMKVRGAGRIARAAADALSGLSRDWKGDSREGLLEALRWGARTLVGTRPTAVSLRNGVLLTLYGAERTSDLGSLKEHVIARASEFVSSSKTAVESISRNGKDLLHEGSTVMTHCNSDSALSVIEAAHRERKVRGVFATESRPWRQGHLTVRRLASVGVPVTLIVDSASMAIMDEVDAVFVGADTISADGSVVNKIGTSMLALAAHAVRVPFYVCAETYKFSAWSAKGSDVVIEERGPQEVADPLLPSDLPGVSFRNPVFDVTPPGHISAIITEKGAIEPRKARQVIHDMWARRGPGDRRVAGSEYWLVGAN